MKTADELDAWLAEHNLHGLWNGVAGGPPLSPHLWKWGEIEEGVKAASELIALDSGGRRGINVRHPNFPDRMTNSIHMSVQCVLPGETATAHRHNPAAVRFIIKGSPKALTVVEGEPMAMETGDFITTPMWTWHDHRNEGDEPVIWLDGLDVRMVSWWRMIWQEHDQPRQTLIKPAGFANKVIGQARPGWMEIEHRTPPLRYPWGDTAAALEALRESEQPDDPYDGIQVSFAHPLTGGATLPTFACELQLLTPHRKTKAHRHLSNTLYHVFRGTGTTMIDGQPFEWSQGDIFLVPPWCAHFHENRGGDDAILFSMDDWPATEALGLYREEEA
jgi:gentisate 1,2-dioxygenase